MAQSGAAPDLYSQVLNFWESLRDKFGFRKNQELPKATYLLVDFMKSSGYATANHDRIFDEGLRQEALKFINRKRWSRKDPNPTGATGASRKDQQVLKKMGLEVPLGYPVHKDPRTCPIEQLVDMAMRAAARLTGDYREVAKYQAYHIIRTGGQLPLPIEIPQELLNEMIEVVEEEFRKLVG